MSTYESIRVTCPHCDKSVHVKWYGSDDHGEHSIDRVPEKMAEDLDDSEQWCDECGKAFSLHIRTDRKKTVRMIVSK